MLVLLCVKVSRSQNGSAVYVSKATTWQGYSLRPGFYIRITNETYLLTEKNSRNSVNFTNILVLIIRKNILQRCW